VGVGGGKRERERERERERRERSEDAEWDTRFYSLAVHRPKTVRRQMKMRLLRL
jgi:hypothetical protein